MNKSHPKTTAPFKKRLSCLLLALLIALTLPVTGCAWIKKTGAYQYFHPPRMVLTGEAPCLYPSIEECWNSEEVNRRLQEYYAPLMEAISAADTDYELFVPEFRMDGEHAQCTIHGQVRCSLGGVLTLPDVHLDNGELTFESGVIDISEVEDGLLTAGKLFLEKAGLSGSIGELTDPVPLPDLYQLFVQLYEGTVCSETDVSRFSPDVSYSDLYMKAKALEMPVYEYELDEENDEYATCYNFAYCAEALIKNLLADYYGVSSYCVSRSDAMDMTELFMSYCNDSPYIYNSWEKNIGQFVSGEHYGVPESMLSRRSFASLWITSYEQMYGDITLSETGYIPEMSDTEDDECLKCVSLGMMDTFPSYRCFSPEYYVHLSELPSYCRSFTWICYNKWLEQSDYSISIDYTYEDLIRSLSRTLIFLSRYEPAVDKKTVINDRDYDWYVSQYNTGRYSDVNCMPTITTMAARWYYGNDTEITAQRLRQDYLPDYPEGWYMFQVTESLYKYGIPYEELSFDEERGTDIICRELDKGRIVLTQMSEAELGVSGHCFVIYGYRKRGDSVRFIVNDPGIYNGTDDFGRYPGDGIWLESGYVNWIICRITCDIVSVGD